MRDVWVGITTGDRAASFGRLLDDLQEVARDNRVRLTLLVAENSEDDKHRQAVLARLERFGRYGHHVTLDDSGRGTSIDKSRKRVSRLVETRSVNHPDPTFIWMLDDDVRLLQELWTDRGRRAVRSHDPLSFLLEMADTTDVAMLIGGVSGDPPVPPIATYASRLCDLASNIHFLERQPPTAPYEHDASTIRLLTSEDAYYDFSTTRDVPTWSQTAQYLPGRVPVDCQGVLELVLEDLSAIPVGGSFTRPILARPNACSERLNHTNSGPNRVFFDLEACVEHPYPATTVNDVRTRRSDMIGSSLLCRLQPGRVVSSPFSVWHHRSRAGAWPTRKTLQLSLIGDTLGALLSREVKAIWGGADVERWYEERVQAICEAAAQWSVAIDSVKDSRTYRRGDVRLKRLVRWAEDELPLAGDGCLDPHILQSLTSGQTRKRIALRAKTIAKQHLWNE